MYKQDMVRNVTSRATDILGKKLSQAAIEAVLQGYADCVYDALDKDKSDKIPFIGMGYVTTKHINAKKGTFFNTGKEWTKDPRDEMIVKLSSVVKNFKLGDE